MITMNTRDKLQEMIKWQATKERHPPTRGTTPWSHPHPTFSLEGEEDMREHGSPRYRVQGLRRPAWPHHRAGGFETRTLREDGG